MKFPYAKPTISEQDIAAVANALKSDTITRGPLVQEFENKVAAYCNAKHAVAFNSASSALLAAYFAIDLGPSDKLITTPNTFIATVSTAMQRGVTPIFLDIDRQTGNFDLEQLKNTLSLRSTRGRFCIAPVHFAGIAMNMQAIDRMITHPDTVVIEDAAHAIGSYYPSGEKVGSCCYSAMTIFSFHPAKTITTGEGGIVTCNDPELYRKLKLFRNNGIERDPDYLEKPLTPWWYEVQAFSSNYNFTEIQAAFGLSQLQRLEEFIDKRLELVKTYRHLLKDHAHIKLFTDTQDDLTAFHLLVAQIDFAKMSTTRQDFMQRLQEVGIGSQVHYIPVYKHSAVKKVCGEIDAYFPEMEKYYEQALSLPLYPELEKSDIEFIVENLR